MEQPDAGTYMGNDTRKQCCPSEGIAEGKISEFEAHYGFSVKPILEKVKLKKTESVVNCYYSKLLQFMAAELETVVILWENSSRFKGLSGNKGL